MSASSATKSLIDVVAEVLRHTSDGDDLSPRDLAILEAVVNSGGVDRLTDTARARWEHVVEAVRNGAYVQPSLHGVQHLTKDHDGYVRWREKVVEHYDFSDDEVGEKAAAEYLSRCCLRLEKDGIAVTSQNLFGLYDRMRRAAEMGDRIARYAVVWNTSSRSVDLRVQVLSESSDDAIVQELARMAVDVGWDTSGGKTQQILITKEDYQTIVESLGRTVEWSRSAAWRCGELWPHDDEPAKSLAVLGHLVDRDRLIDLAQIEEAYLGSPLQKEEEEEAEAAHVREVSQ